MFSLPYGRVLALALVLATPAVAGAADVPAAAAPALPPIPLQGDVLMGPTGCPRFIANKQPYDAATFRPIGKPIDSSALTGYRPYALSFDGKIVAQLLDDKLSAWSTDSGQQLFSIDAHGAGALAFAGNDVLLLPGNDGKSLLSVNAKTGAIIRTYPLATPLSTIAGSPDGRYALVCNGNEALLYLLAAPATPPVRLKNPDPRKFAAGTPADIVRRMDRYQIDGATFSPDSREIAGYFRGKSLLSVWSLKGELTSTTSIPSCNISGHPPLWLPDGSGWLIDGYQIYSRTAKSLVLVRTQNPMQDSQLVGGTLVTVSIIPDRNRREIVAIQLPWPALQASIAAMNGNGPALLRSGSTVAITFGFGPLQTSKDAAKKQLSAALTTALARNNIKLADKAPLTLEVHYEDEILHNFGDPAPVAHSVVRLTFKDAAKTYWTYAGGSDDSGDRSVDKLLAEVLDGACGRIRSAPFPSFIPADSSLVVIPIEVDR
jgi:hypothetical protein